MTDIFLELRKKFVRRCAGDRKAIAEAWTRFEASRNGEARKELLRLAHGLAGAGGTFGFDGLSLRAADAEAALDASGTLSAGPAIADLLAELDSIVAGGE
ncbi:MAG: Hpt domain-containing protein [Rhizobiaceae bacterium]|nr:Hpt domain-containing protein [Rhizobiaceae bacterium]